MDVDRSKPGLVERRSHFVMAVDALLAQDGDTRAVADLQVDLGEIVLRIESQLRRQAGIGDVEDAVEFLLGAIRVVAQRLHLVAGFGPGTLQIDPLFTQHALGVAGDADFVPVVQGTDKVIRHAASTQDRRHLSAVIATDLDQRAEFLVEQYLDHIFKVAAGHQIRALFAAIDIAGLGVETNTVEIERYAAPAGEGHFASSNEEGRHRNGRGRRAAGRRDSVFARRRTGP
jgi:hypothetical protein